MNDRGLVVLDRDGVINRESPDFIKSPAEWLPIPGSLEAIARLTQAGFRVVVATNQSGVGRGLFSPETLLQIHAGMSAAIQAAGGELAGLFVCPHEPAAGCDCRKPQPGLFRQIEARFGESLAGRPLIGDSPRDLVAGAAVNGRLILVRTGNGLKTEREWEGGPLEVFDDLAAAASVLIAEEVR